MTIEIPSSLLTPINEPVFRFIKDLSAHSDIGSTLLETTKSLGDVQMFCPDWRNCRYVIASTKNMVFAVAVGMNKIGFRLNPLFKNRALQTGGEPFPEIDPNWVQFTLFRYDWPKVDLEFWARKAYLIARE